jgi:hypothetical protein
MIIESDWTAAFEVFNSERTIDSTSKQTAAHLMALELFRLKQILMREDVKEALSRVEDALDEIWPHTDMYWEAKSAWRVYLDGKLPFDKEPLNVLRECKKGEV